VSKTPLLLKLEAHSFAGSDYVDKDNSEEEQMLLSHTLEADIEFVSSIKEEDLALPSTEIDCNSQEHEEDHNQEKIDIFAQEAQ
jgi:hypothetical protein